MISMHNKPVSTSLLFRGAMVSVGAARAPDKLHSGMVGLEPSKDRSLPLR